MFAPRTTARSVDTAAGSRDAAPPAARPALTPAPPQVEVLQRSLGNALIQRSADSRESEEGCTGGASCGCNGCRRSRIQPKLTVGQVDDPYEREADRVADHVMRKVMAAPVSRHAPDGAPGLQRDEETDRPPGGNPAAAEIEMLLSQDGLQTQSAGGSSEVTDGFESMLSSTKGSGQPLAAPVRGEMEAAFGADFGDVRVHTDSRAVQMNRDVHSYAFTHNRDIYFNQGTFNPSTREGKHLLAHELTHTIQQGGNQVRRLSITRQSRTFGDCGSRRVRWIFTLSNPAPADGYIVQRVRSLQTFEACPSNVASISLTPTIEFWEAWTVNAGDTHESLHAAFGYTDESSRPPEPDKSGCQASLGNVKFFLRSVTGDLGSDGVAPSSPNGGWGPGNAPPSQSLPSTLTQPSWWNDTPTEGPVNRWASAWWNCCGDPADHFSRSDSNP
jgi:hypothetical protein